jgi:hypothetical protein
MLHDSYPHRLVAEPDKPGRDVRFSRAESGGGTGSATGGAVLS